MSNINVYIEAHKRIEAVISGMDMDDFDKISGTDIGELSEDVIKAMYILAEKHLEEADELEVHKILSKKIHSNLVTPI